MTSNWKRVLSNSYRKHLRCFAFRSALAFAALVTSDSLSVRLFAEEGMFPISEIGKLKLREQGLELTPDEIFSSEQTCLVDGIVKVNGCTGSFVSPDGLIITNHHCAYRAIQTASSPEHDYLENGFVANSRDAELPSPGYTVRITEGFEDVSAKVLSVVRPEMTFSERTKAIEKQQKQLEKDAEASHPGLRAEVSEMFAGEKYVLFLYTYIKDVRLVFAPPNSIGNFGGEVDNWEWPRHTGDFSFMRAYVAPDGSSADYSKDNVPYKPKKFIKVNPSGVTESDFVMMLGYPGRTVRHNTASFLKYEEEVRLPYIVDLYAWQIATMEEAGKNDRSIALKLANRIKSLANVEKRSRGQLQGLRRVQFVKKRGEAEAQLQKYIESDPEIAKRGGNLLKEIDAVYAEMTEKASFELNLQNLNSANQALLFAYTIVEAATERAKPDLERESAYMDKNFDQTVQRLMLAVQDLDVSTDRIMLKEMLTRFAEGAKTEGITINSLGYNVDEVDSFIDSLYSTSSIGKADFVKSALSKNIDELKSLNDPFINLMLKLYPHYLAVRERNKSREGKLSQLYGELIRIKRGFLASNFVPDANGTLRLTYGRVEGYSPADAVVKLPFTTVKGIVDKTTGEDPFITPPAVLEMHKKADFGKFAHPKLNDVPVALLYSTDSTGGNSGSPVLNARGELVGVNFDRTFEATINDFAWDHAYSRSIGVDIRYVLWITGKVYGAEDLLKEMGAN